VLVFSVQCRPQPSRQFLHSGFCSGVVFQEAASLLENCWQLRDLLFKGVVTVIYTKQLLHDYLVNFSHVQVIECASNSVSLLLISFLAAVLESSPSTLSPLCWMLNFQVIV
jgi:hypothetical protein